VTQLFSAFRAEFDSDADSDFDMAPPPARAPAADSTATDTLPSLHLSPHRPRQDPSFSTDLSLVPAAEVSADTGFMPTEGVFGPYGASPASSRASYATSRASSYAGFRGLSPAGTSQASPSAYSQAGSVYSQQSPLHTQTHAHATPTPTRELAPAPADVSVNENQSLSLSLSLREQTLPSVDLDTSTSLCSAHKPLLTPATLFAELTEAATLCSEYDMAAADGRGIGVNRRDSEFQILSARRRASSVLEAHLGDGSGAVGEGLDVHELKRELDVAVLQATELGTYGDDCMDLVEANETLKERCRALESTLNTRRPPGFTALLAECIRVQQLDNQRYARRKRGDEADDAEPAEAEAARDALHRRLHAIREHVQLRGNAVWTEWRRAHLATARDVLRAAVAPYRADIGHLDTCTTLLEDAAAREVAANSASVLQLREDVQVLAEEIQRFEAERAATRLAVQEAEGTRVSSAQELERLRAVEAATREEASRSLHASVAELSAERAPAEAALQQVDRACVGWAPPEAAVFLPGQQVEGPGGTSVCLHNNTHEGAWWTWTDPQRVLSVRLSAVWRRLDQTLVLPATWAAGPPSGSVGAAARMLLHHCFRTAVAERVAACRQYAQVPTLTATLNVLLGRAVDLARELTRAVAATPEFLDFDAREGSDATVTVRAARGALHVALSLHAAAPGAAADELPLQLLVTCPRLRCQVRVAGVVAPQWPYNDAQWRAEVAHMDAAALTPPSGAEALAGLVQAAADATQGYGRLGVLVRNIAELLQARS
jgi:hypothetical protein